MFNMGYYHLNHTVYWALVSQIPLYFHISKADPLGYISNQSMYLTRVCVYITCICQAVSGGSGGQHLPAPISTVLDPTVCTSYCKTKKSESLLVQLTKYD